MENLVKTLVITEVLDLTEDAKFQAIKENDEKVGLLSIEEGKISFYDYAEESTKEFDNSDEVMTFIEKNGYRFKKLSGECWANYNANPLGNKTTDCFIRALSKAGNMSWEDAYDTACALGKENADMPNGGKNCDAVLRHCGFEEHKRKKGDKKITIKEFSLEHPVGTFIVYSRGHATAVVDGKYYDTWDSGDKTVSKFWSI